MQGPPQIWCNHCSNYWWTHSLMISSPPAPRPTSHPSWLLARWSQVALISIQVSTFHNYQMLLHSGPDSTGLDTLIHMISSLIKLTVNDSGSLTWQFFICRNLFSFNFFNSLYFSTIVTIQWQQSRFEKYLYKSFIDWTVRVLASPRQKLMVFLIFALKTLRLQ